MSGKPSPPPPDPFGPAEFAAAVKATPGQLSDLERFRDLLSDWAEQMNLVGPSALANFWRRHALEVIPAHGSIWWKVRQKNVPF